MESEASQVNNANALDEFQTTGGCQGVLPRQDVIKPTRVRQCGGAEHDSRDLEQRSCLTFVLVSQNL